MILRASPEASAIYKYVKNAEFNVSKMLPIFYHSERTKVCIYSEFVHQCFHPQSMARTNPFARDGYFRDLTMNKYPIRPPLRFWTISFVFPKKQYGFYSILKDFLIILNSNEINYEISVL